MSDNDIPDNRSSDNKELEQLLAEKIKLDSMLMDKFSRNVTVMFTDIKGSTSYYEARGDLAGRTMIHQHNAIVLPLIDKNRGTLLKTIGDATMSIFEDPADGLRAATEIQQALLAYNKTRPTGEQIKVRCGLNSGIGLVENNDVYGDVVNVTARIEGLASAGDIFISKQIYEDLRQDDEFIFRFVEAAKVKGKDEPLKVYRLVWNPEDLKLGTTRSAPASTRRVGYYHLEATVAGGLLKMSGSFQAEGEVQPLKQSQEVAYDRDATKACADKIVSIFSRASGMNATSNDFIVELKQLGNTLFNSLIPEVIRKGLAAAPEANLLISMDEALGHIPWEVLHDGNRFLSQKFGIGRTITTRQAVSGGTRALTKPLKMLLLCDPQGNLPAAARERGAILAATADYPDCLAITAREAPVSTAYVASRIHSYDIIHFAGHAEQDSEQSGTGGWLLHDGPLSAATISTLSTNRPMPALVFSNSCHTGEWKIGAAFVPEVFSLANSFLLSGVQHYIGTFWDVPDEPSCYFATRFYGNLVQGMTIGEAMLTARQSLIEEFGEDTIFWASYLLYGDPTTRYVTGAPVTENSEQTAREQTLLRSAVPPETAAPQTKSSTLLIAGGILALVCVVAGYFLISGSRQQAVSSVQPSQNAPQTSNTESDRQLDELVSSLAASYRSGVAAKPAQPSDGWTSQPLSIVIMEITGGSGNNDALIEKINQGLASNSGVSIVERKLLNKMLTELKLSATALTDPATAIKLGKILSARFMITGTLALDGGKALLLLKFIDTETTEVRKMMAIEAQGKEIDKQAIADLSRQFGAWVTGEFPPQGKVTAVAGNQCKLNIGRQHGLKKGDLLEAIIENGKDTGIYTVIAELQLSEVSNNTANALLRNDGKGVEKDVKVRLKRQ